MRSFCCFSSFLSGVITGAALGLLLAPEKGCDTKKKVADAVNDFCRKHNIKLTKKDVSDFVDDLHEAVADEPEV